MANLEGYLTEFLQRIKMGALLEMFEWVYEYLNTVRLPYPDNVTEPDHAGERRLKWGLNSMVLTVSVGEQPHHFKGVMFYHGDFTRMTGRKPFERDAMSPDVFEEILQGYLAYPRGISGGSLQLNGITRPWSASPWVLGRVDAGLSVEEINPNFEDHQVSVSQIREVARYAHIIGSKSLSSFARLDIWDAHSLERVDSIMARALVAAGLNLNPIIKGLEEKLKFLHSLYPKADGPTLWEHLNN